MCPLDAPRRAELFDEDTNDERENFWRPDDPEDQPLDERLREIPDYIAELFDFIEQPYLEARLDFAEQPDNADEYNVFVLRNDFAERIDEERQSPQSPLAPVPILRRSLSLSSLSPPPLSPLPQSSVTSSQSPPILIAHTGKEDEAKASSSRGNTSFGETSLILAAETGTATTMGERNECYNEHYSDPVVRVRSFARDTACSSVPWYRSITPERLADAGFYRPERTSGDSDAATDDDDCRDAGKYDDRVICYVCGIRVSHWLATDEPWMEHAYWSPQCPLVIARKIAEERATALTRDESANERAPFEDQRPHKRPRLVHEPNVNLANARYRDFWLRERTFAAAVAAGCETFRGVTGYVASSGFYYANADCEYSSYRSSDDTAGTTDEPIGDDEIRCCACGLTLTDWRDSDDCWWEHEFYSDECPFVADKRRVENAYLRAVGYDSDTDDRA